MFEVIRISRGEFYEKGNRIIFGGSDGVAYTTYLKFT